MGGMVVEGDGGERREGEGGADGERCGSKQADLWLLGEGGGSGMEMGCLVLVDANSGVWNGWAGGSYCTAQGTVYAWVALLYNRN